MTEHLIVISSPSGGGKTTIIKQLIEKNQNLCYSTSATTRVPRPDEVDGKDYFFLTEHEFKNKVQNRQFLEYAMVHGFYYGSLKEAIDKILHRGMSPILDIDIQGALSVKNNRPKAVLIFIMPPSLKVLELRLRKRGTEDQKTLKKRLEAALEEIKAAQFYDFIVFNEHIEQAISDVECIIHHLN